MTDDVHVSLSLLFEQDQHCPPHPTALSQIRPCTPTNDYPKHPRTMCAPFESTMEASKKPQVVKDQEDAVADNDAKVVDDECNKDETAAETETKPRIVLHNKVNATNNGNTSKATRVIRAIVIAFAITSVIDAVAINAPVAFGALWYGLRPLANEPTAEGEMRSFTAINKVSTEIQNVEDILVDGMNDFARAYCVKLDSPEKVRNALQISLEGLPSKVRETVLRRAIIEGATQ